MALQDNKKFVLNQHLTIDPLDADDEYQLMFYFCTNFWNIKRQVVDILEEIQDLPKEITRLSKSLDRKNQNSSIGILDKEKIYEANSLISLQIKMN